MSLRLDPVLDLGRDTERMTPEDTRRQVATVNCLLRAFTAPATERREVQLLADEVGLGKTFVALAAAYSLLRAVREQPGVMKDLGLAGCTRAAVVVVPSGTLATKWNREVEALRFRCSRDAAQTRWFQSAVCDTAYDLAEMLRRACDGRRSAPCVLICPANVFTRQVSNPGERLRFLAACLFRWWRNRLSNHERYRVLRHAAGVRGFSDWAGYAHHVGPGRYEANLWDFEEHADYLSPTGRRRGNWSEEQACLYEQSPFSYRNIESALDSFVRTKDGLALLNDESRTTRDGREEPAGLLPYCKDAARRQCHEWYFQGFKARLLDLYKELTRHLILNDVPFVVVDEAHHWRNPARQDCRSFRDRLAPFARRLLLLTATPFQLHRDELLRVLAVGDAMGPAIGADRVARLRNLRERIGRAAEESEATGIAFSREWGALPEQFAQVDPRFDAAGGIVPGTTDPRTEELARLWQALGAAGAGAASPDVVPGPLRRFFGRARELQASNERLRDAMRTFIIRHRRPVGHRRVLVGREYPAVEGATRPDQHQLHLAPGAVIPDHAELAQYLLMKVVADASRGRHRTALGMDMTGCYTTLWASREGARAAEAATAGSNPRLFHLLRQVTGHRDGGDNREDHQHPKLRLVLDEALRRWDQGEKTLIFCFRVPTARTLERLLSRGIARRLRRSRRDFVESRAHRTEVRGTADVDRAMQQFRGSLTARQGSGVPLFLDRVLLGWFQARGLPQPALTDADRAQVAGLYARASMGGTPLFRGGDRPRLDRVFLNRAIEHVWATRLLADLGSWWPGRASEEREETRRLLEQLADEGWVRFRYGRSELSRRTGEVDGNPAHTDSAARSSLAGRYDLDDTTRDEAAAAVGETLHASGPGGRASLTDTIISGPNLFVPIGLDADSLGAGACGRAGRMRDWLFRITLTQSGWEWGERAKVTDAVVRALLREDILLRLPRDVFRDTDETWAAGILRGLHAPPGGGQLEPLAGRVEEFLRELAEMGPTERDAHLRYAMNPKAEAVKLVTGDSGVDRDAVFNGFNTPLLPDILVCTQVGQEGIDLHRHCRHVVHYDLGWNPATLEQRTGRADRLGSKALRERSLAAAARGSPRGPEPSGLPGLDVALPYLAGTYDERMYDRLRCRAQAFELLTGGDPSADRAGEHAWLNPDDEGTATGVDYIPLPAEMLEQLRVNLAV